MIHGMRWMWVLGLLIVGGTILTMENAIALTPNESDITGTNYWNNTAPQFGSDSKLDPETLNTARRISQELEEAYSACVKSQAAASEKPRRFARGASENPADCNSPECQRLSRLVGEARTFLSSLEGSQTERLRASSAFRLW